MNPIVGLSNVYDTFLTSIYIDSIPYRIEENFVWLLCFAKTLRKMKTRQRSWKYIRIKTIG